MTLRRGQRLLAASTALAAGLCAAVLVVACAQSAIGSVPRPRPLRVGVAEFDNVAPLVHLDRIAALGFDYVEPALSKLAALPDAEVAAARARLRDSGLRAETMNWFLPGDLPVTGPMVDAERIDAYLDRALPIARMFGCEVIVFGSPRSRSVPEGFPRERAWQQLVEFLRRCDAAIDRHGCRLVIGIEALRRPETNIVNSVAEALQLAREVDRPQIRIIVDFYHLAFEGEDPAVVRSAGPWIAHLQIADPRQRGFPCAAAGEPRYARFFAALADAGYHGRISIEAIAADFDADAAAGLQFLRGAHSLR